MDFLKEIAGGSIVAQDDVAVLTRIVDSDYSDYQDYEILEMENPLYKRFVSRCDFSEFMQDLWNAFINFILSAPQFR